MTQFASKQFEGRTYTFDHLVPSTLELSLNIKGQAAPHLLGIDITYGCHCFTEEFREGVHGDHHRYTHLAELRAFDTLRYECSLQLPRVMGDIPGGLIYKSDESYTYVARIPLQSMGQQIDYSVFFSLRRPGKAQNTPASRLMLYVKSAYPAPLRARSRQAKNWRFKGLVCEIAGI